MNRQPVLFLDRDGIIVVEDQVDSWEKIRYIPGVFNGLGRIRREGPFFFAMVSNQDGVGTPSFPFESFYPYHNRIMETLAGEGVVFDAVHVDFSLPSDDCPGRKPNTGMLGQYTSERFDLPNSVVIGDRLTDVQLAKNLGCKAVWFTGKQNVIQLEEHPELKDSVLYISNDWNDIACFLLGDGRHLSRQAIVTRVTKETQIELSVNLDGMGNGHITTGIGFFDHMLEQIVKHTGFDIELHAHGDLAVDEHHTVEDVAITLGEAVLKALGDKRGISRYGCELLPMDDVLAQCAIDFSGRPDLVWEGEFKREYVGSFPTEMVRHFFKSFSDSSRCNLNLKVSDGNAHHQIEALFKAFSHAMRQAVRRYYWSDGLPSTKGVL